LAGITGSFAQSRMHRRARPPVRETLLAVVLGLVVIAVAFVATDQLSDQPPLVAVGLALLIVLPAWMVFSANYRLTLVALLLYLGLVDGPLKLLLDNGVATLGRDLLLYSIVLGALARLAVNARPVKLPPLSGYVLAFVVVVLVQIFNPGTGGIIRGLAATRPHLEFVPLFLFGYAVMREQRHLRLFLLLMCVIAAANGVASVIQFNLTPAQLASWGPGYADLINGSAKIAGRTFYDTGTGESFVRPFGLGADVGFGGFIGLLAVPALLALIATANRRWAGRLGAPLGVGIILAIATSQTRSIVVATVIALLAFTLLAFTSQRRTFVLLAVAALVALTFALVWSLSGTDNRLALQRYDSISPANVIGSTIESRGSSLNLLPSYIQEIPLGAGLGRVGPGSSYRAVDRTRQLDGESEFNFLVVELGIAGLLVYLALNIRLLALSTQLRRVQDPETRLLLAGCAAPLFGLAPIWLAGPVSAGPGSPYFWFVAGVLAFWLMHRPGNTLASPAVPAR
jgi:hypothetical protein